MRRRAKNAATPEVRFLSKQWDHHSTSSGYHQLARLIGAEISHLDTKSLRGRWIPERVALRFVWRANVRHYSLAAFYEELAAARDMLRRHDPTVYHVLYGDETYRYLGHVSRLRGHKLVASFHQPLETLASRMGSTEHLKALHAVIVVSRSQIPFFAPLVGEDRVHCVPHGIDTSVFKPPSSKSVSAGPPTCLFVGMHKRDFETLAEVIRDVTRLIPEVRFIVVTAKRQEQRFRCFDSVDFRSDISEKRLIDLYQKATLLLQPLEACTANNAILEGLSCGLPLVSTDIGGVRDYADETCALLVPEKDGEAMTRAVLSLLGDRSLRDQLARGARIRALGFDWSKSVRALKGIYERILSPCSA